MLRIDGRKKEETNQINLKQIWKNTGNGSGDEPESIKSIF